jgi:hypothetical protein
MHDRGGIWALKAYKVKRVATNNDHIQYYTNKAEKVNVIIEDALKKKSIPACSKYAIPSVWKDDNKRNNF